MSRVLSLCAALALLVSTAIPTTALAATAYEVQDEASCAALPVATTWIEAHSRCRLEADFELGPGDSLVLSSSIDLASSSGATLTNAGGHIQVHGYAGLYLEGDLINSAGGTIAVQGYWDVRGGATVTNSAESVIEVVNQAHLVHATVLNAGTWHTSSEWGSVRVGAWSNFLNAGTFVNEGTMGVEGTFANEGHLANDGSVSVDCGQWVGAGTVAGTPVDQAHCWAGGTGLWSDPESWQQGQVPPDGARVIVRGGEPHVDGVMVLTGHVTVTGNLVIDATGSLHNHGVLGITGGGALGSRLLVVHGTFVNYGDLDNKDTILNHGSVVNHGDINHPYGTGILSNFGSFDNSGDGFFSGGLENHTQGQVDNAGWFELNRSVNHNDGRLANGVGGVLEINNDLINGDGAELDNNGTVTITHALTQPGNLVNEAGGYVLNRGHRRIELVAPDAFIDNEGCIDNLGTIENEGLITNGGSICGGSVSGHPVQGNAVVAECADEPPVALAVPDEASIHCTGETTYVVLNGAGSFDPDDCDTLRYAWSPPGPLGQPDSAYTAGNFPVGRHEFTLTVTDHTGDTDSDTASFTVLDEHAPALDCRDHTAECASPEGTYVGQTTTATDTCDPYPQVGMVGPTMFPLGSTELTWTAFDASNNSATCTSTTTVVDSTAPALWAQDRSEQCAGPAGTAVQQAWGVSDSCDTAPATTNDAPELFPVGATTIQWTATDATGNVAQVSSVTTVTDTHAPVVTCADELLECLDPTGAPFEPFATATDACDPSPLLVHDGPDVFPVGPTLVRWSAVDDSDNTGICRATVTVVDSSPPWVSCADQVAECAGPDGTAVPIPASVSDVCDPNAPVTSDAPALFPPGVTPVQLSSTDAAGNTGTCTATVTVTDTTAPELQCPEPITLVAGPGCTSYADPTASASNGCDKDPPAMFRKPLRTSWPLGVRSVEFTAIDASGNAATCASTVEVVDVEAPTIECNAADVSVGELPVTFAATAADDCGVASVEVLDPECVKVSPKGKVKLTGNKCEVAADGPKLVIVGAAGGDVVVRWHVRAVDTSGNETLALCSAAVRPRGRGRGRDQETAATVTRAQ